MRLHLIDDWACEIAETLVRQGTVLPSQLVAGTDFRFPEGPCVALGASEATSTFRRLDELAFATGAPWSSVVLTPTGVRLGPVVVPGTSACYECFLRRGGSEQPADGWLPSDLLVGKGFVEKLLGGDWPAGAVVTYSGATGDVRKDAVIGMHGCTRCRPARDRGADTWQGLMAVTP